MGRAGRTPRARVDLLEIRNHIALQSSDVEGDRFVDQLDAKLRLYATQPKMGRDRSDLVSGLRSFPMGAYVVFCWPIDGGVEVVRVLWGGRDLPRLFQRRLPNPGRRARHRVAMSNESDATRYALCVENDGDTKSLQLRKVHVVVPDTESTAEGMLRIVDETGAESQFPESCFVPVDVPDAAAPSFRSK